MRVWLPAVGGFLALVAALDGVSVGRNRSCSIYGDGTPTHCEYANGHHTLYQALGWAFLALAVLLFVVAWRAKKRLKPAAASAVRSIGVKVRVWLLALSGFIALVLAYGLLWVGQHQWCIGGERSGPDYCAYSNGHHTLYVGFGLAFLALAVSLFVLARRAWRRPELSVTQPTT